MSRSRELKKLTRFSYKICRRYDRRSGSSFVPAFRLLPRRKRRAMEAVYAYMHFTDEIADSDFPLPERRTSLNKWRELVNIAISGESLEAIFFSSANCEDSSNASPDASEVTSNAQTIPVGISPYDTASVRKLVPLLEGENCTDSNNVSFSLIHLPGMAALMILPALADVIHRHKLQPACFQRVIDGVERDLDFTPFDNFEALTKYCDCVATAVGFACLPIWGTVVPEEEYADAAQAAGLAFQLTNILRDVREDAENGRVYIPVDELQAAGFTDAEEFMQAVLRPAGDDRFEPLLQSQCHRVRAIYEDAAQLQKALSRDGRGIYRLMFDTYHGLFSVIEKEPTRFLYGKVRYSFLEKLRIAGKAVLHCHPFQ